MDIVNNRVSGDAIEYLDRDIRTQIARYVVNAGDVCLAIVGHTIGLVFFVNGEWDDANLVSGAK